MRREVDAAARRGEFDAALDGQPLDLTENPYVPQDWRLAFKVLKENRLSPAWVLHRRAIEELRAKLEAGGPESSVRGLVAKLAAEVAALNESLTWERDAIRSRMQMAPVDVESEVARYLRR